jgi:hypothetical protein
LAVLRIVSRTPNHALRIAPGDVFLNCLEMSAELLDIMIELSRQFILDRSNLIDKNFVGRRRTLGRRVTGCRLL